MCDEVSKICNPTSFSFLKKIARSPDWQIRCKTGQNEEWEDDWVSGSKHQEKWNWIFPLNFYQYRRTPKDEQCYNPVEYPSACDEAVDEVENQLYEVSKQLDECREAKIRLEKKVKELSEDNEDLRFKLEKMKQYVINNIYR